MFCLFGHQRRLKWSHGFGTYTVVCDRCGKVLRNLYSATTRGSF